MKDDKLYLVHIRESIQRVFAYTINGKEEFLNSSLIQDAVLRNLQTLAESTQRLSEDLKSRYPHTDSRAISGFRNVIVHAYLGVDIERVWQVVESNLPQLDSEIQKIWDEYEQD